MSEVMVPSTRQMIVREKLNICLQKYVGKYERLPISNNRIAEAGLRLDGGYKKSHINRPLVSIITVVRNNKSGILRCMESIWKQTYDNIEYIIIDGGSTDGTVELILQHSDKIDYFVSESDTGIYNAFNKGLSLATGDIITILNSDDWAYNYAVRTAVNNMSVDKSDLLFGAALYCAENGQELYKHNSFVMHEGTIFIGTPVCHNAVYATKESYERIGYYNENLKIAADFKWMIDGWGQGLHISYTTDMLVKYSLGGVSDNLEKYTQDALQIVTTIFPELSQEYATILIENFCMFYPEKYISNQNKVIISEMLDEHKNNTLLIMAIAKCLITKTYQYENIIGVGNNNISRQIIKMLKSIKNSIVNKLRGNIVYIPLRKCYRLIRYTIKR